MRFTGVQIIKLSNFLNVNMTYINKKNRKYVADSNSLKKIGFFRFVMNETIKRHNSHSKTLLTMLGYPLKTQSYVSLSETSQSASFFLDFIFPRNREAF